MEELYRAFAPEAGRIALLITGDRELAADLAQEAFMKAANRFYDLRSQDSFRGYLRRTVVNLARSHFRHLAIERRHLAQIDQPTEREAEANLGDWDQLDRALRTLPHRQRAAVVLRYCTDLSIRQTAEALGTTEKAVESLLHRAMGTLKGELEDR